MTEGFETPLTPRTTLALVIDGVLQQVLNCDPRLGSILLSAPTIVDVTELFEEESGNVEITEKKIVAGNTYNAATNTFTFVPNNEEVIEFPL
jgi:hypothetical protein